MKYNKEKAIQKLMSRVKKLKKGCWQWTGYIDYDGYARYPTAWFSPHRRAHKVSYILFKGEIPEDMTIDHLCRNRSCVNFAHLEVVTRKENVLRGIGPSAINARKTRCKNGHLFDDKNTIIRKNGNRDCRICNGERGKKYSLTEKGKVANRKKALKYAKHLDNFSQKYHNKSS
jgi:5-methylcytosine-specific restriction endonuclease McrA